MDTEERERDTAKLYQDEILRLRSLLYEERRAARTDPVTKLDNRRSFEEQLRKLASEDESFAIIILDACNLHTANEVLGYDAGDSLLRDIAQQVRKEEDAVYRIGGDEFAVIVRDGSVLAALGVAQRMQARVGRRELRPGVSFGLAFGVATFHRGSNTVGDVLKLAHLRCMQGKVDLKQSWGEDAVR